MRSNYDSLEDAKFTTSFMKQVFICIGGCMNREERRLLNDIYIMEDELLRCKEPSKVEKLRKQLTKMRIQFQRTKVDKLRIES